MASNLFKRRYFPNDDGSDSGAVLNNSNTIFIHTYLGDDFTGDGTREYPVRSFAKAATIYKTYFVFRGVLNETIQTGLKIIGDDINQMLLQSNYTNCQLTVACYCMTWDINNSTYYSTGGLICGKVLGASNPPTSVFYYNTFVGSQNSIAYPNYSLIGNCTFNDFNVPSLYIPASTYWGVSGALCKNNLILKSYNLVNGGVIGMFQYTVFSSSCIFKYNGTVITKPAWTNDSKANMTALRNAYVAAGLPVGQSLLFVPVDSFGNETGKVIWEAKDGGPRPNICNRYDGSGNILDYTLNPDFNNEALWSSDTGGYVGCYRPAMAINSISGNNSSSVVDVAITGTDTANVADLMIKNSDDTFSFQTSPTGQIWNRSRGTTTITIPGGRKFKGINSLSYDGSPFGHYIGKHQNIMDSTQIAEGGGPLVVGNIYKVCSSVHDITHAIVYNGHQYLPDYFFKCITGVTSFALQSSGSGAYLQKLLCDPLESIEILPYDSLVTPSVTFPKFSAQLVGECKMLFYSATGATRYAKTLGNPVLFGDLKAGNFSIDFPSVCDKISYYDTWAVTNADQEYGSLVTNAYFTASNPVLTYLRVEVNGHFNAQYDY